MPISSDFNTISVENVYWDWDLFIKQSILLHFLSNPFNIHESSEGHFSIKKSTTSSLL